MTAHEILAIEAWGLDPQQTTEVIRLALDVEQERNAALYVAAGRDIAQEIYELYEISHGTQCGRRRAP